MSTTGELSGSPLPRRYKSGDLDFFIEPRWAVDLMLDQEGFYSLAWDPACGSGTIINALEARDIACTGTDIADRGRFHAVDFFEAPKPTWLKSIISNPPYGVAERFASRALSLAPKVALLVTSKFLYSQRRYQLFADHPPSKIYFLSSRPSMPPGDAYLRGEIKATGGKADYCWIIWEAGRPPEAPGWLRKPRP